MRWCEYRAARIGYGFEMLRVFLFALALLFAAITGLIGRRIYVDQAGHSGFASFYVGGQTVTVDRAMIRNNELREGGAVNRLDLAVTWPDLKPAGVNIGEGGRDLVFIAIEDAAVRKRSQDDMDPADRPVNLYARFLEQDTNTTGEGLVVRRFKNGTPYDGEELFVSSPDEREFSARCPVRKDDKGLEELCLWQIRVGGLEVHTRFARPALAQWTHLSNGVKALVQQLATRPSR